MFLTKREKRRIVWGSLSVIVVIIGLFSFFMNQEQSQQQNVDMLEKEGGQEIAA